ncbi:MAG: ABC transporter ATP-binding protein [Pseudobdellovibrionaceae bacterium]|nr:ABC transporter ATP-binding protein [Bdellovibrionales bacterium]USN47948.1 MAG: ABC transporter ATP-binding protein [Pseudobdellovibrionaceae bacterium]
MILETKALSRSYIQGDREIKALQNFDLSVREGSTVAIVGPSGSGKSTLLSLLAGLDTPSSGTVKISGQDLNQLSESRLTEFRGANIGIVFQQFHLMAHLSALENVALPLEILNRPQPEELAIQALRRVGLETRCDHKPHQLSGGERQRVAIARAFVVQPKILLADEPSGNLDTETGQEVMSLLFELVNSEKMTMLLVTHDTELAIRCDRQVRLVGGVQE